jgi:uncharacterized protein YbaP (TraB family)
MSRAYRITVKDSVRRVVRAEDHVRTQLEMLEVLPCEQMIELLADELSRIGFQREGDEMVRVEDDIRTVVDLPTGTVTVSSASAIEVEVQGQKSGLSYDDRGASAKEIEQRLQRELDQEIDKGMQDRQSSLQQALTDRLEAQLADIRQELDRASNRATASALKQKAAQLGQIKEMTEDPQSGSLTIVVEL